MKKKILAVVMSIFAAVLLVGAFAGCSDDAQAAGDGAGTTVSVTLNKKYIEGSSVSAPESEQTYFIFSSADSGKYHYYYYGGGTYYWSYTINFHYKVNSDVIFMFYDSVEYDAVDTRKDVESSWAEFLIVDADFKVSSQKEFYVCEDYLGEIPNFGK